jgi:chromosome partitioning protein
MRTVAIINQKGGCGKTTTSINLAACLARLGFKTLLVDMDPQGHCGLGLAVPEEQIERTIYDALIEPSDGKQADLAAVVWQIASDFDLAPSSIRLAAFEQVFAGRQGRDERLKLALERVKAQYTWCIIDCPPSVGLLTFNALKACDEVIVPVETGYFSLHGLAKMMQTLEVLKQRCGKDILIRVLPTLYDTRTKLAREVLCELRGKFRQYLMESTVNFNTKLKEAASFGQPITEYDPGSRGYRDFVTLARELMGSKMIEPETQPLESLSRPAELVQRAKQLAQMAQSQLNRPSSSPPTVIGAPSFLGAGGFVGSPTFASLTSPVVTSPTNESAGSFNGAVMDLSSPSLNRIQPPFLASSTELPPAAKKIEPPVASKVEPPAPIKFEMPVASKIAPPAPIKFETPVAIKTPPPLPARAEAPAEMIVKSKSEYPTPALKLLATPNALSFSLGSPAAEKPKPAPETVKTTEQKIEEFYGVKQIGATVIFAAHFNAAKDVLLAGDFNGWMPQANPMKNGVRPGLWRTSLKLKPGRYKYRLVVDGRWVTDPNNTYVEVNQFGELDNIVEVGSAN